MQEYYISNIERLIVLTHDAEQYTRPNDWQSTINILAIPHYWMSRAPRLPRALAQWHGKKEQ